MEEVFGINDDGNINLNKDKIDEIIKNWKHCKEII